MDITKKEITASSVVALLPDQAISREVLLEKYAKGTETSINDVRARIAHALAAVEPEDKRSVWEKRFLQAMEAGFIPAGRIMSAAGIQMQATLIPLRAAGG
jgi:ribonucleoside-diphosphate reductase alpha chain